MKERKSKNSRTIRSEREKKKIKWDDYASEISFLLDIIYVLGKKQPTNFYYTVHTCMHSVHEL